MAIKRALANLIQNALRYTQGDIEVITGYEKEKGYVYFIVSDEGEGILEADIEHLFQPFTQGDKARGTEGSGLGLAISKRIIELHGSRLRVSSQLGRGTEFSFDLKAAQLIGTG